MRFLVKTLLALLIAVPALADDEAPARKLSPKRTALLEAVEELHTLRRRAERGGQTEKEIHDLKHALRRAHDRVKELKHQILKEERRSDDYYQDDPYPTHRKDPETGGPYKP